MPETTTLTVGTVLRAGDPEPPDGTNLLDASGRAETYEAATVTDWPRYLSWGGPFVVVPDFTAAVAADEAARAQSGR